MTMFVRITLKLLNPEEKGSKGFLKLESYTGRVLYTPH